MLRGLRHCQLITTWDGLGPLLIIAKAFHMVQSRSFRGCTLRKPTIRLGERWRRPVSEGCKPRVPGLPAGVYAAVACLSFRTPLSLCLVGSSHSNFFFRIITTTITVLTTFT